MYRVVTATLGVSKSLLCVRRVGVRIAAFAMAFACVCPTVASAATFTAVPTSLAFGNQVINSDSATQTITLTNTSKNALVFTLTVTGLSDYTVTSGCGNVLPPSGGASCMLTVVFHPVATGSRPGSVLISDNGKGNNKQTVPFSGNGVAAVSVTPSSLAFGNVGVNTTSPGQTVTLTNNQGVQLTGISFDFVGADFGTSANTCSTSLAPQTSCSATVVFNPHAAPGTNESATLTIAHSVGTNSVSLTGRSVVAFTVAPSSVTFSSTLQGATSSSNLTLTNNLSYALTVALPAPIAPFGWSGCAAPVAAGTTCAIAVSFSPTTQIGALNASFTVSSPQAASGVVVPVAGTAIPRVILTPNPVAFGNQTVASTGAPVTLTILNNQPTQLTFGNPLISFGGSAAGDYALASTTCRTKLAGNATCTASLTFHPTRGGARSATAGVNSNAFGSPHLSVLTGTGTTPITVSPGALTFGNVNVGVKSAGQTITVQNNQSVPVNFTSFAVVGDFGVNTPGTTCSTTVALAANGNCTLSVSMTPTVVGNRNGSLTINSDASESPAVALSGVGINGFTASPLSLTFASQTLNTTSLSQLVTVTNLQSVATALTATPAGDFAVTNDCGGIVPAVGTCGVSVTFTPTALGTRSGTLTVNNPGGPSPIIVTLTGTGVTTTTPAITDVTPGSGTLGTTLIGVVVTGNAATHFAANSDVSFGAGIAVANLRNVSAGSLTVDLSIDPNAIPGARTVSVTTDLIGGGTEVASLAPGFTVASEASLTLVSVTPDHGKQAESLSVDIVGSGTHFKQDVTFANFDTGVSVSSLTIHNQTSATATIDISPTTTPGWRRVVLTTGGEQASLTPVAGGGPGFEVRVGDAAVSQIAPNSGAQGSVPFTVAVTGTSTHFQNSVTVLSLGSGVNVSNVQVQDATHLTASVVVTLGATVGARDVIATTGGEIATLSGGFSVTAFVPPSIADVSPSQAQQGAASFTLTITGANTQFTSDVPSPSLTLGSNIAVSNLQVVSDTSITATIDISPLAVTGARNGTLTSGATNFNVPFTVLASDAAIVGVSPGNGAQGSSVQVTVTGGGTHWQQGTTSASLSVPGPCAAAVVDLVDIQNPTTAVLHVTIPANACVGPQTLQLTTGGEIVTSSFNVYANTPSLVLSPSSAKAGTSLKVNLLGEFSHFVNGATLVTIDGAGVTIQDFVVTTPTSATVTFVIDAGAPSGACGSQFPGCHTVTLATPLGGATETLTAGFNVTSTPAVLTEIQPSHAAGGTVTNVTIRGSFTHFAQGQTTVGFGPDIVTDTPVVISETELTVGITVGAAAATGWRSAFINTGSEQLSIGFHIDVEAAPAISSVNPASGAQGQSLASVTVTGTNTNFNASSQLMLGAGVTVTDHHVVDASTITASIDISATAPVGPNAVIVITDLSGGAQEIATGTGFSVVRGPAQILSVAPNLAAQGQVLNVAIVGQGTHWLAGETSADFGGGIVVNQLTINDATHAKAQITVLNNAAPGFRTVSLLTDGEYVAAEQGLAVSQNTPTLSSSSPNAGQQGTTFDVQVLGSLTHWVQGSTTASYGPDVTASVVVHDSVTATLTVTIDPLALTSASPNCRALTMATGLELVSLPNQLCVQPGAATLLSISPNAAPQGSTLNVFVTGQNTHFENGLTMAAFAGSNVNVTNVTVISDTTATLDVAVTSGAATGLRALTLTTAGEVATLQNAFNVGPNTPTLNAAAPTSAQQGQSLVVHLIGQYTHWAQGATTVTFGQGITPTGPVVVTDPTNLDVPIAIDVLAQLGGRAVTVTTGPEIVFAPLFTVTAGGALITEVAPQTGNQGQDVVLEIQGTNTTWLQGITQFGMTGAGNDIKINFVVIDSTTHATVGITIAPEAQPGARSIYMVTAAEALVDANAFVVTGGVPAIASLAPASAPVGSTSTNVGITGLYTHWISGDTSVEFGPGVTVTNLTVDSETHLTAVVDVALGAALGARTVVVRTVSQNATQALTARFDVVSNQPPPPQISYVSPTSGLRGQTFTINIGGQYTHWSQDDTSIDFGDSLTSGITVNTFQITSQTSARANITIAGDATFGQRIFSIQTDTFSGAEVVQSAFSVVQETPQLTLVDPPSGMQGETKLVNVLGQYTGFNGTTTFDFGPGVLVSDVQVLGANVAQIQVTIDQLAVTGLRFVTATTNGTLVGGATFTVTPSQAVIVSVTPNTARQQDSIGVAVVGRNTHWSAGTIFTLDGSIAVSNPVVSDATHATLTLNVGALAALGLHGITATTGGEAATLASAFVVQPGTPLLLSSGPPAVAQQQGATLTILGQYTTWQNGATTVAAGAGVFVSNVNVTTPTSLTANIVVDPLTTLGPRTIVVTTGAEVLTLGSALAVTRGPAAVQSLNPAQAGQAETTDVVITGVNTHFIASGPNATIATFGAGISVNSLQVHDAVSATANISVDPGAIPGQRTVTLTTAGEVADKVDGFLLLQTIPYLQSVQPASAKQGQTLDVTVTGSLTSFTNTTVFDFGPGVTVNAVQNVTATHATVNVTVSSVAMRTTRDVTATTNGVAVSGTALFTVTAGDAILSAATPSGIAREQTLIITVTGNGTHFQAATPAVSFGAGVNVSQVVVDSDTQLRATVTADTGAVLGFRDVTVTTLGEVAQLIGVFHVDALVPIVPTIDWPTPAAITYGTALSGIQLNATANVDGIPIDGTFSYSPNAGTYLHAGLGQTLLVTFTPLDQIHYAQTQREVLIDVNHATLQVVPDDKSRIIRSKNPALTYHFDGFKLDDTAADVSGSAVLSTTAVIASPLGTYPISADVSGLSASDYTFSASTGTLTVLPAGGVVPTYHVDSRDPVSEGFTDDGGMTTAPVADDGGFQAWQISGQGQYHQSFDPTAAFAQGWRLATRVRVVSGSGPAVIGLRPGGSYPRFDLQLATDGADTIVSLAGSSISYRAVGAANQWTSVDLVYDPTTLGATLFVNGVQRANGYLGAAPAPVSEGTVFGVANATANFNLVKLEVGTDIIDFEDQPIPTLLGTSFPTSYRGITWTNWLHQAPYLPEFQPDGFHAIYAAADGATLTFPERHFFGAEISRDQFSPGDIYFELYHGGQLVATSPVLDDDPPQRTFLASGYAGLVDEIRVRAFGAAMTAQGSPWIIDNLTFSRAQTKTVPVITWNNPGDIVYGTALDATQLNATANVTGTFTYTPVSGTVLSAGSGQTLSVDFTPEDTLHYQHASKNVLINVLKATQAALQVTGAPQNAVDGTGFAVGYSGGSGTGDVTFNVSGACVYVSGNQNNILMTAGTGTCDISVTQAGDNNYTPQTSSTVHVIALPAVAAFVDIVESNIGGLAGFPASFTVRLRSANGVTVAPSSDVALTISSTDPNCVVVNDAVLSAGSLSVQVPIAHGTFPLTVAVPACYASVTVSTTSYDHDTAPGGFSKPDNFYPPSTALSYYNPAPIPDHSGTLRARGTALSYYNPATVPSPDGAIAAVASSLSYYNPATLPDPSGAVQSKTTAVSYYNPATVPSPGGAVSTAAHSVSFYNPSEVPDGNGSLSANVISVSYFNPDPAPQGPSIQTLGLSASGDGSTDQPAIAATSLSIANGPTAISVAPLQLRRGTRYSLTIAGANLRGATDVTFGGGAIAVLSAPVASADGTAVIVDVLVSPTAATGLANVVVSGNGWSTAEVPNVRVEIVP